MYLIYTPHHRLTIEFPILKGRHHRNIVHIIRGGYYIQHWMQ